MIPETSVDWKAFEYKYSSNPQRAFENLAYFLFCHKFNQRDGIFRYFNQPHIETNPIKEGKNLIGFQAKYYDNSVAMSGKQDELIEAVKGAAKSYPGITILYFYISREFSASSKKNVTKPKYQINIEKEAENLGIEIVWQVLSNIEAQLMQDKELTICRNVFFQVDSAVQSCCENLENHKRDIFEHIRTSVSYNSQTIVLQNNELKFDEFIDSGEQVLIVDGDAGSGKSALMKQVLECFELDNETALLVFKSTDMDVEDKLGFLKLYGELTIDEVLDTYKEAKQRILYIDAVEKYFTFDNLQAFEDILQMFIKADWKVIFTIRTAYKESFHNLLLNNVNVKSYHVKLIDSENLMELANQYGFHLPRDKKLTELLCVPFYLGLYLSMDNLEDEELLALNREAFEEKIWEDIVRNNKKRKNSMPTRREDVIVRITMEMLQSDSYLYTIQASDDHEAFSELEQSGVLIQTNDTRKYCHSHDVFEELVVNHIFMEQYRSNIDGEHFFSKFRTSLRTRKLFRGWLSDFVSNEEHQNIIFNILNGKNVDRIWKDEVLLAVISTENLKNVCDKLLSGIEEEDYTLLKQIASMTNTCCRVANHTNLVRTEGKLLEYRLSKPSGYAWEALFRYIDENKDNINWDDELISDIIEILDSWTKHKENAKTQNTKRAGEIGLFFFDKLSKYSNEYDKLCEIILNSAWMISDRLNTIFENIISEKEEYERNEEYVRLAKCAVADILQFGNVPYAMPEMTIKLMRKLWIRKENMEYYHSLDMDGYFGIVPHLSDKYEPASAYKTPIHYVLIKNQMLATEFIIDFCNMAGEVYVHSHLNTDYKECYSITIHVGEEQVEQIASDRLWKMHRGTHVGPELLKSLLMGFEAWMLEVVKNSRADIVAAYCRNILKNSRNVMLTSIIVSVAEAYPEKMLEVICDLLKTKEIFHLDSDRLMSERTASAFMFRKNIFEIERRESNELSHRKKSLEDSIRLYQTKSETDRQQIYNAIDEATKDIDTWPTQYKYAYYRMDLRRYNEVIDVKEDESGNQICTVMPAFSDDMKALSEKSKEEYDNNYQYLDLQLWSEYKYEGNIKYKEFKKYVDISIACQELREVCAIISNLENIPDNKIISRSLTIHRYIAAMSYTSAVLLRDYSDELNDEDKELCESIIVFVAEIFVNASDFEIVQAGNGLEAIVCGLILMLGDISIWCQLIELVLKEWGSDSRSVKAVRNTIWKYKQSEGWRFVYLFSLLAEKNESTEVIEQVLEMESIQLTDIELEGLRKEVLFTVLAFIPANRKEACEIAKRTKDLIMPLVFGDERKHKNEYIDLISYSMNYTMWLADVLLCCGDMDRRLLIDSILEAADIAGNDNVEYLIKWLIQEQDIHGKTEEFWKVWELLKPCMIELCDKKERYYYSSANVPCGRDQIITTYLFANSMWKEGVYKCDLLTVDKAVFFDDFIDRTSNVSALLYALAKLLNTVGKETYEEHGIEWMYRLVQKDLGYEAKLYDNTMYYMEEYMCRFVHKHQIEFGSNIELAHKTQEVLVYMINRKSQVAFFISEQM